MSVQRRDGLGPCDVARISFCVLHSDFMKAFVHARLDGDDRAALDALKRATGRTEAEIVRRGLQLVAAEVRRERSALDAAGRSAGRFKKGPRDLSTRATRLEGFGE